ncbi:tyrosine-type recombinase/integrase [Cloacibacillus evryensis]|uniref:tyrosine-type recombinase/integrase n=1 Tax=Cloacibacillus evryensis TaxID=508460 RepID=UPI002B1FB4CE|nr:tyrosine-type recombinase/integrase [Cloacibacillus evryensis]MEA5034255.1 tyrosine-type recombinase/integrase [Cloacibacillus evryensis]
MPTMKLTQNYIDSLPMPDKGYWVLDSALPGLRLYIGKTSRTYYIKYINFKGKTDCYKLGDEKLFTPIQAREAARQIMAQMSVSGSDVKQERKPEESPMTLKEILEKYNETGGSDYIRANISMFSDWLPIYARDIDILKVEIWRENIKEKRHNTNATINRRTSALSTLLNWAVTRELISYNPIIKLKKLPETDSEEKIRYLLPDEHKRLMKALAARDNELKAERSDTLLSGHRQYLFDLSDMAYADYLTPSVILSLNTGFRQSALFSLQWNDIDMRQKTVLLRSRNAKSKKYAVLPLNDTAMDTLTKWLPLCGMDAPGNPYGLVFPSPSSGKKIVDVKTVWKTLLTDAQIENFRWHDMRHDFASQLVMRGVDLYTVKELMTHSDIKMTMRYAHLAPSKLTSAVNLLCEPEDVATNAPH